MIRTSYADKIICSVCGSRAIFPFGICLDCLEWASSILALSTPSAPPVSAGGAEGVFLSEKSFDRCSNTGRTLHVCNIAQNLDSKKSDFEVAFGRVFEVEKP